MTDKKLEDYSLEDLEVKKRISQERIEEMKKLSLMHRISEKIGFNLFQIIGYAFILELIGLVIVVIITFIPLFINPGQARTSNGTEIVPLMIVSFPMIITAMFMRSDPTYPHRKELKEIEQAMRIKRDVYNKNQPKHEITDTAILIEGEKLEDESDILEYKASFKYDINKNCANKDLPIELVQGVQALLNNKGGTLKIGVRDSDKKFIGLENDLKLYKNSWDKYLLDITTQIVENLGGTISDLIKFEKIQQNGLIGCNIVIKQSSKEVWYKEGTKEEKFMVRINNRNVNLTGSKLNRYIDEHFRKGEMIKEKLLAFKSENDLNLQLIDKLIAGDVHYLPRRILTIKLGQNPSQKFQYTSDEIREIVRGGMHIPKENFSYDYCLQVIDIGHYLDRTFIDTIKEYIEVGKKLNQQKDFCQQWIIARSGIPPNPDEANNYYSKLDIAKTKCEEMKTLIEEKLNINLIGL
jgi:hypothetical protein